MFSRCVAPWLRILTVLLSLVTLIASIICAQERPPAGQVNTEHSRVYIFVDKTGVVGHQHAIEGKLASGHLFLSGASNGALVFNMKSFDADTPRARSYIGLEGTTDEATRKKVNENMLGVEILNVNKFGTAGFENAKIQPKKTTSKRQLPEVLLGDDFTLHEKKHDGLRFFVIMKSRMVGIICEEGSKSGNRTTASSRFQRCSARSA